MDTEWRAVIWQQFGAAIDMLDNALVACRDELWSARLWRDDLQESESSQFWYVGYHALFWLDLYLSGSVEGFAPPAPFGLEELDPAGILPERPFTKDELKSYVQHARTKARAAIEALTDEKARQRFTFSWGQVSYLELLLYNMRHVQEHAAQLNLFLGQTVGSAPGWVGKVGILPMDTNSTRISRHVNAPRANVYRALLDGQAVATWMVPIGMTSYVHAFDAREGGLFRISLTYDEPTGTGKTTAHTDTYHGHFVKLVPNEQVVEVMEFETSDAAMRGEMIVTFTLADAGGGTDVLAVHDNLPPGLSPADNETGWRMALDKLAAFVEAGQNE